jgi:hypothetical protein
MSGACWPPSTDSRILLTELADFLADHRPHGPLTADATEPAWNGYLLMVACPCGVMFGRWVTPVEAETDLISWSILKASRN